MEDSENTAISTDEVIEKVIGWAVKQNFPEDSLEVVRTLRNKRARVMRNLRDSIFTHLFRHERYVLALYKALHPEDTDVTLDDIRIITIENVMANGIHNDLGFSVRDQLFILVEAQTKWSENIVLRELQYLMDSWDQYLWETKQDVYQTHAVKLPEPQLYALFPEIKYGPETLTLADIYFPGKDGAAVDCCVHCIYAGAAESRSILGQYTRCAQIVGEALHQYGATPQAVEGVVRRCKEENILIDFIESIRGEILRILDTMTDEERQEHLLVATENVGIQKGVQKGIRMSSENSAKALLSMGILTIDQIAEATQLTVQDVRELAKSRGSSG